MFVFTRISPIISCSSNIQVLTDDKREESRALMMVAIFHCKISVEILFMLWIWDQNLGWCTFNFGRHQARALRFFNLVKRHVSENQRMTDSVQIGVGVCIFKGGG